MNKENIEIPPRPKLFQWYYHKNPKIKFEQWDIWIIKKGTVLWGFTVHPNGESELNNTNLRYWDEKDFPWHKSLHLGEFTKESNMPRISHESKLLIIQTVLGESKDSEWLYKR